MWLVPLKTADFLMEYVNVFKLRLNDTLMYYIYSFWDLFALDLV